MILAVSIAAGWMQAAVPKPAERRPTILAVFAHRIERKRSIRIGTIAERLAVHVISRQLRQQFGYERSQTRSGLAASELVALERNGRDRHRTLGFTSQRPVQFLDQVRWRR